MNAAELIILAVCAYFVLLGAWAWVAIWLGTRTTARANPRPLPPVTVEQVRTWNVYAAVPELRTLPVEDAAPMAATCAEIHALPTYRGGR